MLIENGALCHIIIIRSTYVGKNGGQHWEINKQLGTFYIPMLQELLCSIQTVSNFNCNFEVLHKSKVRGIEF